MVHGSRTFQWQHPTEAWHCPGESEDGSPCGAYVTLEYVRRLSPHA